MSDLTSKAEVLETYSELFDMFDDSKEICKELCKVYDKIMGLPTTDAVPVVRCKDCKKRGNYFENINQYACLRKGYLTDVKPPNWFCADRERNEE